MESHLLRGNRNSSVEPHLLRGIRNSSVEPHTTQRKQEQQYGTLSKERVNHKQTLPKMCLAVTVSTHSSVCFMLGGEGNKVKGT